jgi:hypothetical protein
VVRITMTRREHKQATHNIPATVAFFQLKREKKNELVMMKKRQSKTIKLLLDKRFVLWWRTERARDEPRSQASTQPNTKPGRARRGSTHVDDGVLDHIYTTIISIDTRF